MILCVTRELKSDRFTLLVLAGCLYGGQNSVQFGLIMKLSVIYRKRIELSLAFPVADWIHED